jgi:hypothetical protein
MNTPRRARTIRRCIDANGSAFFGTFRGELEAAWGDPSTLRLVRMEFFCRMGRHLEPLV